MFLYFNNNVIFDWTLTMDMLSILEKICYLKLLFHSKHINPFIHCLIVGWEEYVSAFYVCFMTNKNNTFQKGTKTIIDKSQIYSYLTLEKIVKKETLPIKCLASGSFAIYNLAISF